MLKYLVKSYRSRGLKKKLKIREGCCLYKETCSAYAERIIDEKGDIKATFLILQRILLCNPIGYNKIGVYLYEKKNPSNQKISQAKANYLLVIFFMLIIPLQFTGFFLLREFAIKPIYSVVEDRKI